MVFAIILFYLMGGENKVATGTPRGKKYCAFMGIFIFLIGALRSTAVGSDTGQYARHFYEVAYLSWHNILFEYGDEPGYYVIAKIISSFTPFHQWMMALVSAIVAIAVSRFIYCYSKQLMLSFVMLLPMMYLGFFLTAQRQAIALSIILFSYPVVLNRKLWKFAIIIAAAFLFHHSVIFAIPLFFISKSRIKPLTYVLFITLFVAIYAVRSVMLQWLLMYVYDEYQVYSEEQGTLSTLLMYVGIWCVLLGMRYRKLPIENSYFYERLLLVGIVIQSFVPLEPNIYRVAFYYLISSLIIVPMIIQLVPKGVLRSLTVMATIVLMFVLYYKFTYEACGINPYEFFWEQHYVK